MTRDNRIGKLMFAFTRLIQVCRFLRVGILRMVAREQQQAGGQRRMSMVLWDMFTGSAPYGNVFVRTLHPCYWGRLVWESLAGLFHRPQKQS
jgi:hypothetical protein